MRVNDRSARFDIPHLKSPPGRVGYFPRASYLDGLLRYLRQQVQDGFIPSHRPYSRRTNHP